MSMIVHGTDPDGKLNIDSLKKDLAFFKEVGDVTSAKVSVDQVVDVFYVLDENGHKLEDPERISQLRTSLLDEINKLTSA